MYRKIRFTNGIDAATAGLVIEETVYQKGTIESLSRLFPYYEATKMNVFQASLPKATWDEAFTVEFTNYRTTTKEYLAEARGFSL